MKVIKLSPPLAAADISPIIEVAWEDRTPFEVIAPDSPALTAPLSRLTEVAQIASGRIKPGGQQALQHITHHDHAGALQLLLLDGGAQRR